MIKLVRLLASTLSVHVLALSSRAFAQVNQATQDNIIQNQIQPDLPDVAADSSFIGTGFAQVFFFAGFVSMAFIVVGGLRYALSAGDPQKTAAAKDTVLYAVIGLIITLTAFTIIRLAVGVAQS